ncbi:transcriptional regulator, luxr family, putative [Heliomicrobium modesticaldum Ice1]|uniref:Stage 0 sporulation protein A homolog n=1 Tax=Heliobacterium modesticaldum (strain ATCC 51547 / Ice1) TaxID=498761 RepID=B0TH53_HELMI|nr:response regulator transcription factor [Heliomicrobium modesticaldum]ABZ83378.1 transcriptional regulator, luxr family, putative [Heliomicrobium modesticaldum Ice1]
MEPIRLILADDHTLLRQGVRKILELDPRFQVLEEAGDGQGAINLARRLKPDVILMDIHMPGVDGVEATRVLKREQPQTAILVLTAHEEEDQIIRLIEAGVDGYLLKDVSPETLYGAIVTVARGGSVLNPAIVQKVLAKRRFNRTVAHSGDELTEREKEVLGLIAQGSTNADIASALFISEKTVKNHITNIFRKLQVKDRTQAALYAIKNRLVKL